MTENLIEIITILRDKMNFCELLGDDELEKVVPCFELVKYKAGSVLFNEGEPGDFMGFVKSGKLEVKKQTEFKGKQIILAILGEGSFVGELSTFDKKPRSTTVTALEDSELILLRRETLDTIIKQDPQTAIKILEGIIRIISIRLRKVTERLTKIF